MPKTQGPRCNWHCFDYSCPCNSWKPCASPMFQKKVSERNGMSSQFSKQSGSDTSQPYDLGCLGCGHRAQGLQTCPNTDQEWEEQKMMEDNCMSCQVFWQVWKVIRRSSFIITPSAKLNISFRGKSCATNEGKLDCPASSQLLSNLIDRFTDPPANFLYELGVSQNIIL